MSTPFLLGTSEAFDRLTIQWFLDDVTKPGNLHAYAQETYLLQKHPCVTRMTITTMSILAPSNSHRHCTLPHHPPPPINILNALPIDHMLIDTTLWAISTREMLPIPVLYDDHLFHPLIKLTTSICQKI